MLVSVLLLLSPVTALAQKFYVVDRTGNQIFVFDPAAGFRTLVPAGRLNSPRSAAIGPDGNLYVSDFDEELIGPAKSRHRSAFGQTLSGPFRSNLT